MPKKRIEQKEVDEKGSHYIKGIFINMKATFIPIYIDHDIGFDCSINFTEKKTIRKKVGNVYSALTLRAQLKSGDSYIKKENDTKFEYLTFSDY